MVANGREGTYCSVGLRSSLLGKLEAAFSVASARLVNTFFGLGNLVVGEPQGRLVSVAFRRYDTLRREKLALWLHTSVPGQPAINQA